MRIVRFGEGALLVGVPEGRAAAIAVSLRENGFWQSVVPTGSQILVTFDPAQYRRARVLLAQQVTVAPVLTKPRTVIVPVTYGGADGMDLARVAAAWGVSEDQAIRLHSDRDHQVLFLGFMPGFPYLESNLPPIERLATPRNRVPAGSVGVAGTRTGVYPAESPGGWCIIGRTAVPLFDASRPSPTLLLPGDIVRFEPTGRMAK